MSFKRTTVFENKYIRWVIFPCLLASSLNVHANLMEMMTVNANETNLSGEYSESVDLSKLQPALNNEDIRLKGEGPDLVVARFYDEGIFDNNYFGSWTLALDSINITVNKNVSSWGSVTGGDPHTDLDIGGSIDDGYANICSLISQSSDLGNSPYLINGGKKDLLVLDGDNNLRAIASKWSLKCSDGAEGVRITGTSPDGVKTVFKPMSIGREISTLSYLGQIENSNVNEFIRMFEDYSVIRFYPETLTTPTGRSITYTYNTELVSGGESNYLGTGLCYKCNILPEKVQASDDRFIQYYYQHEGSEFKSVIDYIEYGNAGSTRSVDYSYEARDASAAKTRMCPTR